MSDPLSDEELVRLALAARSSSDFIVDGGEGPRKRGANLLKSLSNAVLNRFEKKARKVEGWVIVNDLGHFGEWENFDEISEHCKSRGDGSFPIYVTGTEGIGPDDITPPTEKREGREFCVIEYWEPPRDGDWMKDLRRYAITHFDKDYEFSLPSNATTFKKFRVREILEGEA